MTHPEKKEKLEERIIQAAHAALEEKKYVSAIDVLLRIGWLMPGSLKDWQLGKLDSLERRIQANLKKISCAMRFFRQWALKRGLKPNQTACLMRTKGPKRNCSLGAPPNGTSLSREDMQISPFLT